MLTAIAAIIAAGLAAPLVCRRAGRFSGWVLAVAPLGALAYLLTLAPFLWSGGAVEQVVPWAPSLGVNLAFRLDGLSLVFALLIAGMGALVAIYSGEYLAGHAYLGRYYVALLMFMGSMLGLVLSDNAILLYVFWELTSITSYLLIGFDDEREAARRGALQALLVTASGGLALLAGLVLAGQIVGTYRISELLAAGDAVRTHHLYPGVLGLVALGAFTKSAQFPFHFWLPNAMEAPTPASAYLHAATMVKAGVYLLARLTPAFGGTDLWMWTLTGAGAVTMLLGAWIALQKTDLKQILAYSTVSVLGILVLLLGLGGDLAWTAMIAYLLAHGFYKGALFLVAGAVDHETGTRDIARLGGLRRAMPFSAAVALLAAVSMAGLPPALGFIGKELVLDAALQAPVARFALAAVATLAGALLFAAAGLVSLRPFWGAAGNPPRHPHEAPLVLWLCPAVLAAAGVVLGLVPGLLNNVVRSASSPIAARPGPPPDLALFHGFNLPLLLSVLAALAGSGLYAWRSRATAGPRMTWDSDRLYDAALACAMFLAVRQTRILQNGYLRYYLLTMIVATVTLTGIAFTRIPALAADWRFDGVQAHEVTLVGVILASIAVAVRSRSGLTSVAALGVVGIGMALIFVLFGAPDLAITQVVVDMLTVILLVLVLYRLPEVSSLTTPAGRARDLVVATSAGGLISWLVLITSPIEHPASAARYFVENSVTAAGGRNVVNVILVDFRGLDTLGEITVLAVAAIGVYSLSRLRPPRRRTP